MGRMFCVVLAAVIFLGAGSKGRVYAEEAASQDAPVLELQSVSAILMEASTGKVIYEKNADEALRPASITKIMTLILIFDALAEGKIGLSDEVVTSAHAKSMGGSQVYLKEGEVQTVETLIKCIVIASGNDASVAMAEYIAGSEEGFVQKMNERAEGLGMEQTNFEDCCGLTDSATHVSSARDVALMSRELVTKYPQIYQYSTIWMENITHVTRQGTKEFCLTNTNKLLKSYEGILGLKTGSTSLAKYCLSATAIRNDIHLIAVIMAAPDYKARFQEASALLNYGYANVSLYQDEMGDVRIPEIAVKGSIKRSVSGVFEGPFSYLCTNGEKKDQITREVEVAEELSAPVEAGQTVGTIRYFLNGKEIGTIPILADSSAERAAYPDYLRLVAENFGIL